MTGKSPAIVGFLASLSPLYVGEHHDGIVGARSLSDGTLVLPVDESTFEEEVGTVRVQWQGDTQRETETNGSFLATLAIERYVRLHGTGCDEETIAAELWYLARHFEFKTGCSLYLPQLEAPPSTLTRLGRATRSMGNGVLANALCKAMGLG